MAADKDAELIEVTHSVSIPIIRIPRLLGQVYREKELAVGGKINLNGYARFS